MRVDLAFADPTVKRGAIDPDVICCFVDEKAGVHLSSVAFCGIIRASTQCSVNFVHYDQRLEDNAPRIFPRPLRALFRGSVLLTLHQVVH